MNSLKIAVRSIQHRGLGSLLTILSMALGVMLVVAVLTMHGVVSKSFKANSNFSYDNILASSGSGMQVTMNTVFYLLQPVETIPYEYYLAFRSMDERQALLKHSMSYQAMLTQREATAIASQLAAITAPAGGMIQLLDEAARDAQEQQVTRRMGMHKDGKAKWLAEMAVPVALGDYLGEYRVVGTTPEFFEKMYIDVEAQTKIPFAEGRPFQSFSPEYGYFEAVVGSTVARNYLAADGTRGLRVGDEINPKHGDPDGHTHDQAFTIVGVMAPTGTPNDRATFINLDGFYLMEDHAKDVEGQTTLGQIQRHPLQSMPVSWSPNSQVPIGGDIDPKLRRTPLPIEQREVTAVLVRAQHEESDDEFMDLGKGNALASSVNQGWLDSELQWSDFRPLRQKEEVQAVNPVLQVTTLFSNFVNPIRWILLVLTIMICIVSGISILVGIYNSMSERKHEIAVMRALGAGRQKVMAITLLESITLALAGGIIGWVSGHILNSFASPYIEAQTGVSIGFWDFAPGIPMLSYLGISGIPFLGGDDLEWIRISPELFLIPGLILLAVLVGVYPAISAYRTDVAESLGT